MKCPDLHLIEDYLSGELQGPPRQELEAHLETCLPCQAVLDREKRMDDLLRRQPVLKAPLELRVRVLEALTTAQRGE